MIHFHLWDESLNYADFDLLTIGYAKASKGEGLRPLFDQQVITTQLQPLVEETATKGQSQGPTLMTDADSGKKYLLFDLGEKVPTDWEQQKDSFFPTFFNTIDGISISKLGIYLESFQDDEKKIDASLLSVLIDGILSEVKKDQKKSTIQSINHYYFVLPKMWYRDVLKFVIGKVRRYEHDTEKPIPIEIHH